MQYSISKKYHAMMRAYQALLILGTDNGNEVDNVSAGDVTESFFNQCYHLKDWIKKAGIDLDVEDFINKTPPLRIAADFCNSMKHAGLTHPPRSGESVTKILTHVALNLVGNRFVASSHVEIHMGPKSYNAIKLATDCVAAWKRYFAMAGILIEEL